MAKLWLGALAVGIIAIGSTIAPFSWSLHWPSICRYAGDSTSAPSPVSCDALIQSVASIVGGTLAVLAALWVYRLEESVALKDKQSQVQAFLNKLHALENRLFIVSTPTQYWLIQTAALLNRRVLLKNLLEKFCASVAGEPTLASMIPSFTETERRHISQHIQDTCEPGAINRLNFVDKFAGQIAKGALTFIPLDGRKKSTPVINAKQILANDQSISQVKGMADHAVAALQHLLDIHMTLFLDHVGKAMPVAQRKAITRNLELLQTLKSMLDGKKANMAAAEG